MNKAKRKNILIDLSDLKHPNCGFGQIAINYSKRFIIRKTKRFAIPERAVYFLKTKRTAGGTPPPQNIFDRLTPVFT